MAMNLTKLSQAGGIAYLMNTVISGDTPRASGSGLSAYYAAAGTPPGRWLGKGAEAIGITTGWHVSQEGAEALFRRGAHPLTGVPLGGRPVQLHAEMDAPVAAGGGQKLLPVAFYRGQVHNMAPCMGWVRGVRPAQLPRAADDYFGVKRPGSGAPLPCGRLQKPV